MPRLHDPHLHAFASDNYSGIHPEVLAAIAEANDGHLSAYGDDVYTTRLNEVLQGHFGSQAQSFPTFNGTGANVVSLAAMLPRWGAVICAATAHINVDEGGAPERMGSLKLLSVPTPDGKLTPELVDREAWGWGNEHRAQPLVVSITQTTELGTAYTAAEISALAEHAHARGMHLHLDGARLSNAAAHLDLPLRAFTTDAGVDVVSLGGTKSGILAGEAVVVLNPEAATGLPYVRKLSMQLASKMRFASAQLIALYDGDLWLRNARHANEMAALLRAGLEEGIAQGTMPGLRLTQQTESNAVFAVLPSEAAERIRSRHRFYDWDEAAGEVRWMCSFDTTPEHVHGFLETIASELTR